MFLLKADEEEFLDENIHTDPLELHNKDNNESGIGPTVCSDESRIAPRRASYIEIFTNRLIPPMKLLNGKSTSRDPCSCKPTDKDPCGRLSNCVHVLCGEECCSETCPAAEACQNQKLSKRDFPSLQVIETADRGRGVICVEDVPIQTVMTEYVGEVINQMEVTRRKTIPGRKDFYLFKMSSGRFVDAERVGNLSRYINHSCDANCFSEKIKVDGNLRIAIISNQNIKAVSHPKLVR